MNEETDLTKYEEIFQGRFGWRKPRQLNNMVELGEIAQWGGHDALRRLRSLGSFSFDEPLYALKFSILTLWLEAAECYIFGHFQSCILTCGALVERCLKYEYQKAKGSLPKGHWTLGRCVHQLDWKGIIDEEIVDIAKEIIDPRNSRAHALLEHDNPDEAYSGGNRGVTYITDSAYIIEYYRGDAREVMVKTWEILEKLYGTNDENDQVVE